MYIERFLTYLERERRLSPLTVSSYRSDLQFFCDYLNTDFEQFNPNLTTEDDIKAWMIDQMDHGVKARSVCRRLSTLHSLWKYLLRMNLVQTDITQRIIAPKITKPLPVFYRETEVNNALAEADTADDFPSVRDNLIIDLLYETGMRQAELLTLRDEDIDHEQSQIRIFGKRQKERIVPIGNHLLQRIDNYIQYRNEAFPNINPNNRGTSPDINPNSSETPRFLRRNNGANMTRPVLYTIVRNRMSEVSTLKKQSPHVLRHTFATTMLNHGADINSIKELMGHANLGATQIYTHTTFEELQRVYRGTHPRETNG